MSKHFLEKKKRLNNITEQIKLGDIVYCHATSNNLICLTQSILVRLPLSTSPVYKVIVVDVYTIEESQLVIASKLLGKRIPIQKNSLSIKPADWILNSYKYKNSINMRETIITYQRKRIERVNNGDR